jgi:hypothetical protein
VPIGTNFTTMKTSFFYPQEKVHCEDIRLLDCLKYNLNLVHQMFEEMALLHISRKKKTIV